MKTMRKGSKGRRVQELQHLLSTRCYATSVDGVFGTKTEVALKAFQKSVGLKPDGIAGPKTLAALVPVAEKSKVAGERDWASFVPLLGSAMNATYSLSGAQVPKTPPGASFLQKKYIGSKRTNCSMFSAYFLGCGFGGPFTRDHWYRWQLAGGKSYSYRGYGPGVCVDWGVAEMMPKGALPVGGVYLLQIMKGWPRGHSWMVLDFDEATGKFLSLEANTKGTGLNGVGFWDLGPIRSTNARGWKSRVKTTWEKRLKPTTEVSMARLAIDHQSVLDWIEGA